MIDELKNLNDIQRVTKRGIYKIRLARSNTEYLKVCDYMQKINAYKISTVKEKTFKRLQ